MNLTARSAADSLTLESVHELLGRGLLDLVFDAARVHREHHDASRLQCSQLLSIKTGGCPEDCSYCSQSAHHRTPVEREPLVDVDKVRAAARAAKARGADRFCMGAAWREVREGPDFETVLEMVREVKGLGLETCATLGMLNGTQAQRLQEAGLDYYNHNLDTGRNYYDKIVSTRSYDQRLATLAKVREAGIKVCCGGIIGLGEERGDRAELLFELATMQPPPESVPINELVRIEGTPLQEGDSIDWSECLRCVAAARILMPRSVIRLSAGRRELSDEAQALCFLAGANSIFLGDELLTTPNPDPRSDAALMNKLGLVAVASESARSVRAE